VRSGAAKRPKQEGTTTGTKLKSNTYIFVYFPIEQQIMSGMHVGQATARPPSIRAPNAGFGATLPALNSLSGNAMFYWTIDGE
jgi:hypothetical protein